MLHRLAAFLIVLTFIGPEVAGAVTCAQDGGCGDMAAMPGMRCCAMAKLPGASAAMTCCQVVGRQPSDDTTTSQAMSSAPQLDFSQPAARARVEPSIRTASSQIAVSMRSAQSALLHHDPPDLFLDHSTFLI